MKKITITRNNQFVGSIAKCWIVLNISEEEAQKLIHKSKKKLPCLTENVIPIVNGQTISIELSDNKTEFYAAYMAVGFSKKIYYSNKITIDEDCPDKAYALTMFLNTAYNRSVTNLLELKEV